MTDSGVTISPEARQCLQHILTSDTITRAPRVHSVLTFVIERVLAGEADRVNEESIGQEVFGRPEGYNRSDDNIVRVTMRHLRARLEEYYGAEGGTDGWILEIPKGSYVPVLRARPELAAPVPEPMRNEVPPRRTHPEPARPWLPWALCAVLLAGYPVVLLTFRGPVPAPTITHGLVQDLFYATGQRVFVVPTDANLQLYRMMFQRTVTLDDYIERRYTHIDNDNPVVRGALRFVAQNSETSLASSSVILLLQRANGSAATRIRHPHDLAMRDFQQDNAILLGGPWINPWGQLFEDRLNFRIHPPREDAAAAQLENLKPEADEPSTFRVHNEGTSRVGYARIGLLPNLSDTGRVVLIGATDNGAIEAGGRFIVDGPSLSTLLTRFQARQARDLPNFEVVLEVRSTDSTPRAVRVVASRVISPAHTP